MPAAGSWISHQVSEFLARVTSYPDEGSALRGGSEHTGEALEAEVVMILRHADIMLTLGLVEERDAERDMVAAVDAGKETLVLPALGPCHLASASLEDGLGTRVVVARAGDEPFSRDEQSLLDNMSRTLGLVLRMLRTLDSNRAALRDLEERQLLLERLARVQGSISHRAPLQEVLDAITEGACELLGDEFAAIRLLDETDPRYLVLASASGLDQETFDKVRRIRVDEGVGGEAFTRRSLAIIENYSRAPQAIPALIHRSMQSAMGVPLFAEGNVVGSLITGTRRVGRRYTPIEQEMLRALGENASIALTDARTLESMREARRTKDAFLTMVSHELKTPLTVILGSLHTLRNRMSELPDGMKEDLLDSATRRGDDLLRLIDMLLLSARADLVGAREKVFLPAFLAEAIHRSDAARPMKVSEASDVSFWADATSLHQVVRALLENAVAHSPDDSEITVSGAARGSSVTIAVRNRGTLPDVDVATLFMPFQRGPQARSSGVGLGLYIAQTLADAMKGRIEVDARDGSVEFRLTFNSELIPTARLEDGSTDISRRADTTSRPGIGSR